MEMIGAIVDKLNTLMFEKLKEVIELRIMAIENVE